MVLGCMWSVEKYAKIALNRCMFLCTLLMEVGFGEKIKIECYSNGKTRKKLEQLMNRSVLNIK